MATATRSLETPAPEAGATATVLIDDPPRLAPGAEPLGRYRGSGYRTPRYLIRRADGQMVQLPALLYALAERLDGGRTYPELAQALGEYAGRGVDPEDVRYLVETKLAPLGIVAVSGGDAAPVPKLDPLLALRFRTAVVPRWLVRSVTWLLRPLFLPPVVLASLAALGAFDTWLLGAHGVAQPIRDTILEPSLLLLVVGLIIASAAFHEFGHATACRYGGARTGSMGVGLYLVWPAFYTDITDSYRLSRGGRLRADLGGLYFNALSVLVFAGAYFLTDLEALLVAAAVVQLEMLMQFLPFLRMDGYYMLADLTGVPDLFSRIGSILRSLVPWKRSDDRVRELKPWVRAVVTFWVLLVVPILAFNLSLILISAPRILSTAWTSFGHQVSAVRASMASGRTASAVLAGVQAALLALPALGIVYTFARIGRRVIRRAREWSADRPVRRVAVVVAGAALVGTLAFLWRPSENYEPIRPSEQWTAPQVVHAITVVPHGHAPVALGRGSGAIASGSVASGSDAGSASSGSAAATAPAAGPSVGPAASPSASPSSSPSPSRRPSPSPSASPSPTPSSSPSPSPSPSPSSSPSPSPSAGSSPNAQPSPSPAASP